MRSMLKIFPSGVQYLWISILIVVLSILHLIIGHVHIATADVFLCLTGNLDETKDWEKIILSSRFCTLTTSILAGMALALSGWLMQTFFRNPVAGPFVLGISSGASLAVALMIYLLSAVGMNLFLTEFSASWLLALLSFAGSLFFSFLILLISRKLKSSSALLVAGLMLGSASSALITIFQSLGSKEQLQSFVIWTFGSFSNVHPTQLIVLFALVILGTAGTLFLLKPLNLLLLGEDYAKSMGLNLPVYRLAILSVSSILAGVVTAFCGPIAFIGLAVPHMARATLNSSDHRKLFPMILLTGALVSLFCSLLTQIPVFSMAIPINAITSAIGAPFVIWIVLKRPMMIS